MARLFKILAVIVVLVLALLLALILLVDKERLVALASERLERETGARLEVSGPVELAFFPRLELAMRDATLTVPDGGSTLQAGLLETGIELLPLLRRQLAIDRIALNDIVVTLVADDAAARAQAPPSTAGLSRAELDALYAARREARRQGASQQARVLALPLALDVGSLVIEQARVLTVDSAGNTLSAVVLDRFDARGVNSAGRPVPIAAQLQLPAAGGGEAVEVAVEGELTTDLDAGRLTISDLEATVTGATRDALALGADGVVTIGSQTASLNLSFSTGATRGEGELRYAGFDSPQVDAKLSMNRFTPALLALAGPEAAASPAPAPAAIPYDALRAPDLQARLRIGEVALNGHLLRDIDATLRLREGTMELSDVAATLHGGELALAATLDARYAPATLESTGTLDGLQLAQALAPLELELSASGSADLSWTLESRGSDGDALLRALTGPVTLRTEAVELEDVAIEEAFCRVVALVRRETLSEPFPENTSFTVLEADATLANGTARLQRLAAKTAELTLDGSGSLSLLDQDFEATVAARLAPGFGERDRACRLDGRLVALSWPVACAGNLAGEPADWCGLDTEAVLGEAVQNEAERKIREEAGKLLQQFFDGR
jgi:uncharacterized protein involved in outer membrane biogenesis